MKKILFILPSLTVGGLERVQVTIANMLVQKNYDVTVITLSPDDDLKPELDERVHYIYKPPKQHLGNKIPYIRHVMYDDGMWERRVSAKQLYNYYVGEADYDVEIAFFRGTSVKIISGSTNKRAIHLAWVHSDYRSAYGYANCFKNGIQVYKAYKSMNRVVCVSNQAQEGFREVIGDTGNLLTIYNPLPVMDIRRKAEKPLQESIHHGRLHIVLVGRLLNAQKGQKRLIEVVLRLHNEGVDISLALVGGGVDEQMLKNLIRDNNAESYITLTGAQLNP